MVGVLADFAGTPACIGERLEFVPEAGAEHAVAARAANLKQEIRTPWRAWRPLRIVHAPIDEEIRCAFGDRRSDLRAGAMSPAVIDRPLALATQIAVDFMQRARSFEMARLSCGDRSRRRRERKAAGSEAARWRAVWGRSFEIAGGAVFGAFNFDSPRRSPSSNRRRIDCALIGSSTEARCRRGQTGFVARRSTRRMQNVSWSKPSAAAASGLTWIKVCI
jgi:hypothetical protein